MTSIHLLCRGHTFAPISLDNSSFPFRGFCAVRKFLPFLSCFLKLKSLRLIRGNKKKKILCFSEALWSPVIRFALLSHLSGCSRKCSLSLFWISCNLHLFIPLFSFPAGLSWVFPPLFVSPLPSFLFRTSVIYVSPILLWFIGIDAINAIFTFLKSFTIHFHQYCHDSYSSTIFCFINVLRFNFIITSAIHFHRQFYYSFIHFHQSIRSFSWTISSTLLWLSLS